jgi:hypothetical protein
VHRTLPKRAWSDERIRSRYLQRSVVEILTDGDSFVLGPCPERTFVAAAVLTHHRVPYQIVYHERHIAAYGPPTAHIAVEIEHDGKPFWFDFGYRETRFLPGTYFYKPEIEETIQILRFPSSLFDPLTLSADDVFRLVSPQRIEMRDKLDWYCAQMRGMNPELLQEHLIYNLDYSLYNRPRLPA